MSLFNYFSDEVKRIIEEVSPNYPQLTTYEKEWLYFYKYGYIPGIPVDLEYQTAIINPTGSVSNAIPFRYKSAILKGNTKYRDIDTGDILDTFDETKNLELVSVKMPVLMTRTKNNIDMFNYLESGITITNKNNNTIIFNSTIEFGGIFYNDIQLKPNTTYTSSFSTNIIQENIRMYLRYKNTDGTYSNNVGGRVKTLTFTTNNTGIISLNISSPIIQNGIEISNLQIEDGSIATSYESRKSNILTVNEEVELRGIGDVKDELNLLTGELTQRIETRVYQEGDESNSDVITDLTNTVYKLTTESVKTVDLTPLNKPYEGVNHYELTSNIPCEAIIEVPVVSTGEQTLQEINN